MVALNFKRPLHEKVESGEKTRSIRAMRKTGNPSVGCRLQLYFGMRTKHCRKLHDAVCTSVRPIKITWDGEWLGKGADAFALAISDGFTSTQKFLQFFDREHGLPFEGQIIEWEIVHDGPERRKKKSDARRQHKR